MDDSARHRIIRTLGRLADTAGLVRESLEDCARREYDMVAEKGFCVNDPDVLDGAAGWAALVGEMLHDVVEAIDQEAAAAAKGEETAA